MIQKSGQELSPCVEVNGQMLADISGEELEGWLIQSGLVSQNNARLMYRSMRRVPTMAR